MKKPNKKNTRKSPVKKASGILSISLGSMMLLGQTAYSIDMEKEVLNPGYISETATDEKTLKLSSPEDNKNNSDKNGSHESLKSATSLNESKENNGEINTREENKSEISENQNKDEVSADEKDIESTTAVKNDSPDNSGSSDDIEELGLSDIHEEDKNTDISARGEEENNVEAMEVSDLLESEPLSGEPEKTNENKVSEVTGSPSSEISNMAIYPEPRAFKSISPKSTSYTYKDKDNNEITTKWVKGIIPPMMGEGGDFYEEKILSKEFFVTPQDAGKGWYDVNKNTGDRNIDDSRLCSGVAAANMLHWWLDQNAEYVDRFLKEDPKNGKLYFNNELKADIRELKESYDKEKHSSKIFDLFKEYFGQRKKGVWADTTTDMFINGYFPSMDGYTNSESSYNPDKHNYDRGFFRNVFKEKILTKREYIDGYDGLSTLIKERIDEGKALAITHWLNENTAHILTVWGADYDSDNKIKALYISDSDDYGSKISENKKQYGLVRYKVENNNGILRVSTDKEEGKGAQLFQVYSLSTGADIWKKYFEGKDAAAELKPNTEKTPEMKKEDSPEKSDLPIDEEIKIPEENSETPSAPSDKEEPTENENSIAIEVDEIGVTEVKEKEEIIPDRKTETDESILPSGSGNEYISDETEKITEPQDSETETQSKSEEITENETMTDADIEVPEENNSDDENNTISTSENEEKHDLQTVPSSEDNLLIEDAEKEIPETEISEISGDENDTTEDSAGEINGTSDEEIITEVENPGNNHSEAEDLSLPSETTSDEKDNNVNLNSENISEDESKAISEDKDSTIDEIESGRIGLLEDETKEEADVLPSLSDITANKDNDIISVPKVTEVDSETKIQSGRKTEKKSETKTENTKDAGISDNMPNPTHSEEKEIIITDGKSSGNKSLSVNKDSHNNENHIEKVNEILSEPSIKKESENNAVPDENNSAKGENKKNSSDTQKKEITPLTPDITPDSSHETEVPMDKIIIKVGNTDYEIPQLKEMSEKRENENPPKEIIHEWTDPKIEKDNSTELTENTVETEEITSKTPMNGDVSGKESLSKMLSEKEFSISTKTDNKEKQTIPLEAVSEIKPDSDNNYYQPIAEVETNKETALPDTGVNHSIPHIVLGLLSYICGILGLRRKK